MKSVLAILLIAGLGVHVSADATGTITQLSSGSASAQQINPLISGPLVVWTDASTNAAGATNFDVFLLNLTTGVLTNLTNTPDAQEFLPDLDGSTVVWTRTDAGTPGDIVAYDVQSATMSTIATSSQVVHFEQPAIHGHNVAYLRVSSTVDVVLFDLSTGTPTQITNDAAVQGRPRVGDDVVVYEDYSNGNADILAYRISTGAHFPIATGLSNQITPDIDGNTVVWVEGTASGEQIFAFDLLTGTTTQLTTSTSSKVLPRISGSRVVWSDDRSGNLDLYMYDLSTGTEQPLVSGSGDQFLADIDHDKVVYTDNSAGFEQVFLASPSPVYSATVQQPIKSDGSSVFNAKRGVVPVKFTLAVNGTPTCQLPPATLSLTRTAGGALGAVNESDFTQPSDSGSNFRVDTGSCQYVYNLGSSSLGTGTYLVQINVSGSTVGSASFSLK